MDGVGTEVETLWKLFELKKLLLSVWKIVRWFNWDWKLLVLSVDNPEEEEEDCWPIFCDELHLIGDEPVRRNSNKIQFLY